MAVAFRNVEDATLADDGSPPITRTTFPTCRAHYPGGSRGCACRLLPHACSLPPKRAHNAGCLTLEVVVSYPFHPLVGRSVLVVGDKEHGGVGHLIVRKPDGAKFLLPEWMTLPEAGTIRILSCPRLSVNRLVELRALIDRLMASSPGKHVPGGGQSNETSETISTRYVQDTTAVRTAVAETNHSSGTAHGASGGGNRVRRPRRERRHGRSGAQQ